MKNEFLLSLRKTVCSRLNACLCRLSSKRKELVVFSPLMDQLGDLTMRMRTQCKKMGLSRCAPFITRCATKTEALTNIAHATPRDSTSTQENIMCDFPHYKGCSNQCLLDLREKLRHLNDFSLKGVGMLNG